MEQKEERDRRGGGRRGREDQKEEGKQQEEKSITKARTWGLQLTFPCLPAHLHREKLADNFPFALVALT